MNPSWTLVAFTKYQSSDSEIRTVPTWKLIETLSETRGPVASNVDGTRLAVGGFGELVKICDSSNWEIVHEITDMFADALFLEPKSQSACCCWLSRAYDL